jgi:hypothetical protein
MNEVLSVPGGGREEGGIGRRLDSGKSHMLGGRRVEGLVVVGGRIAVMVIDEKRKGGGDGWNARVVSSAPKQAVVGGGVSVKYEGKHVQVLQARGHVAICGRWW